MITTGGSCRRRRFQLSDAYSPRIGAITIFLECPERHIIIWIETAHAIITPSLISIAETCLRVVRGCACEEGCCLQRSGGIGCESAGICDAGKIRCPGIAHAESNVSLAGHDDTRHPEVPWVAGRRAEECTRLVESRRGGEIFYFIESRCVPAAGGGVCDTAAIHANAYTLQDESNPLSGLTALDTWISDLPRWQSTGDWRWTTRFAYQVIEKRGTGGCGFRTMYAEFLSEAARYVPHIEDCRLPILMQASAQAWCDLAMLLKAASEASEFPMDALAECIRLVKTTEQQYVSAALRL